MPEISQEQSTILDAISQAVKGTQSSFTQSSQRSDTSSAKQTPADKADRVRADKASRNFKDATKHFSDSVNRTSKTADQWKLQAEQSSKFLDTAVNAVSQQSSLGVSAFKNLEDTFKLEDRLEFLEDIRKTFADGKEMKEEEYDEFKAKLHGFGLKLSDVGMRSSKLESKWESTGEVGSDALVKVSRSSVTLTKNQNKLNEQVTDTTKELKEASTSLQKMADSADKAADRGTAALGAVALSMKLAVDESRIAMRTGVGDARDGLTDTTAMVFKLGVSTSKYMEVMADSRRVQLAMNSAGKSWKEQMVETSNELQFGGLVGSAEEGLMAASMFAKNTAMMGVAQKDLGDAIGNQTQIYKNNFRALAISTEQFNALTEDMLADVDIRKDIAKLQGNERRLYVESLQKRTAENMMMGFSIDRAKELNKHFARISDQDPLERISDAAKMRAGLGAMGMEREGAIMQELLVKLPTLTGDKRIEAQATMTKILEKAQTRGQELMSQSVQANVAYGRIIRNLNIKEKLERFQTDSRAGMKITQKNQTDAEATRQLAEKQQAKEVGEVFKLAVRLADTYQAALTSSTTAAVTVGASYLAGNGLKLAMGSIVTSLGTLAAGAGTAAIVGTAAVVAGGGALAAYALNSEDTNKNKETREANKSDERKKEDVDRQIEVQKQMLEVQKQQKASTDSVNKTLQQGNSDRVAGNASMEQAAGKKNVSDHHLNQKNVETGTPSM